MPNVLLLQPTSIGFYVNCFGQKSAKWIRQPMKPVPLDREKSAQDNDVDLLDQATARDPTDNVTK
jgi:hypothetical protein